MNLGNGGILFEQRKTQTPRKKFMGMVFDCGNALFIP